MGNLGATHPEAGDDGGHGGLSSCSRGGADSKAADSECVNRPSGGDFAITCCQREVRWEGLPFICFHGSPEACMAQERSITVTVEPQGERYVFLRGPSPQQESSASVASHAVLASLPVVEDDENQPQAPPSLPRGVSGGSGLRSQTNQSAEALELLRVQARIQALLNEQLSLIDDVIDHSPRSKDRGVPVGKTGSSSIAAAAPCRMAFKSRRDGEDEEEELALDSAEVVRVHSWRKPLSRTLSFRSKGKSATSIGDAEADDSEVGALRRQRSKGFPAVVETPRGKWA